MRIQGICKKYNIDFESVKKILLENGFNSLISSNTKIDNVYLEFFEIAFDKDREKKEISEKNAKKRLPFQTASFINKQIEFKTFYVLDITFIASKNYMYMLN